MRKVNISAAQFYLKPIKSFIDFEKQVSRSVEEARESDFLVFGEFLTLELLATFPEAESLTVEDIKRVSEFTDQYLDLFSRLSTRNCQHIVAGRHIKREADRYYDVCYIFQPNGEIFEHKKTHVVPLEMGWGLSEGDDLEILETDKAKVGVSICYEAEIPECARILALKGAEIIFCPSFTISEAGFWRVRHCCQARCVENQVYMVHCSTVGDLGILGLKGFGRASILSPCHEPWPPNGVIAEGEMNREAVISGEVDVEELYVNREKGIAPTFRDRTRRASIYKYLSNCCTSS